MAAPRKVARNINIKKIICSCRLFVSLLICIILIQFFLAFRLTIFNPFDTDVERRQPRNLANYELVNTVRCNATSKDVESAISRATSDNCKHAILSTWCEHVNGSLYLSNLPRFCPYRTDNVGEHVHCIQDNREKRVLGDHDNIFENENSPLKCVYHCLRLGYRFAGVEFGRECWCGNSYSSDLPELSDQHCNMPCSGDASKTCGGYLAIDIYHTGYGLPPIDSPMPLVDPTSFTTNNSVRIAFVLTVNGRAVRQVLRLLKALYRPHHYFYIHVDARQEYMYREISAATSHLANVRMAKQRYASIWGGASLLTMLLQCMTDLLAMSDWQWDFFLNLSESDYPLKTTEHLTAFLTTYRDRNFVRSHGKDTPKFIKKQGLDRLFYECDNHLWRLGPRDLPDGIRIDGGSDWICLNRNFCKYIITSSDTLITGLKQYWTFALLPAESFFHTVLQNSEFCLSFANNNLHLTNWRRSQGCKCQYRHIVDWCGCSPNVFLLNDYSRLLNTKHQNLFFARKFEAAINQNIINVVHQNFLGTYPSGMQGLQSYWQNEYSRADVNAAVSDHKLTYYNSMVRIAMKELSKYGCSLFEGYLTAVNALWDEDDFKGLLISFEASLVPSGSKQQIESYLQVKRKARLRMFNNTLSPAARLQSLEVGSDFDPKEELFRNYASLLGPYSDIVLRIQWSDGGEEGSQINIGFIDPSYDVAIVFDHDIKIGVNTVKPDLKKPLRPGLWLVRLVYKNILFAETSFTIIPQTYIDGLPVKNMNMTSVHNGPKEAQYSERNFSDFSHLLGITETERASHVSTAQFNARLSGDALLTWVDKQVIAWWVIKGSCVAINNVQLMQCSRLSFCRDTSWSSFSPDPKSQI